MTERITTHQIFQQSRNKVVIELMGRSVSPTHKFLHIQQQKSIKMFRNNGWKVLIVETGSVKTKGKTGKNTELKTIAESNARYLLYLDQDHWEYCFPSLTNKLIKYDITIVDNKSGEQVFSANGNDCRTKINEILNTEFAAFW